MTIADYEARRAAAVGRLARAVDRRSVEAAWREIAWCDAQIRRLLLTTASAAAWASPARG